jgi:hypothetical protein
MMKIRSLLHLSLLTAFLAACAPSNRATSLPATATEPPAVLPTFTVAAPSLEPVTEPASTEEAAVLPAATSRGPDLHATDPTTVSLASGGLQFVEFFRFT